MIVFVSGTLVEARPTAALVDVAGLGYEVLIPTSTYEKLPAVGNAVKLHTHYHVREDAQQLFGFFSLAERNVFQQLITVSGIGPKLGLAALSAMTPVEIRTYILKGEAGMLTRIPGVGRKTAERLVVDLRDKMGADGETLSASGDPDVNAKETARADALAALEALGLSRAAAERNLRKVIRANPDVVTAEALIRLALREG